MRITQTTTKKIFHLIFLDSLQVGLEVATYVTQSLFVAELPGTVNGSRFLFFLGSDSPDDLRISREIQAFLNEHDVVAVYAVRAYPNRVHSAIARELWGRFAAAVDCSTDTMSTPFFGFAHGTRCTPVKDWIASLEHFKALSRDSRFTVDAS